MAKLNVLNKDKIDMKLRGLILDYRECHSVHIEKFFIGTGCDTENRYSGIVILNHCVNGITVFSIPSNTKVSELIEDLNGKYVGHSTLSKTIEDDSDLNTIARYLM